IPAAQHRLFFTGDPFQPAVLGVDAPGKTETRREVRVVSVVSPGTLLHLYELRGASGLGAGFEEIARPGNAKKVVNRGGRVTAVVRCEGALDFPTQTVIDCHGLTHGPAI